MTEWRAAAYLAAGYEAWFRHHAERRDELRASLEAQGIDVPPDPTYADVVQGWENMARE